MDTCLAGSIANEPFPDGTLCPESGMGVCVVGHCVACSEALGFGCPNGLFCIDALCVDATCKNNVKDPGESTVDCGGPCSPCTPGNTCVVANDCDSEVCLDSICQPPTSTDGRQNGGETGKDCGCPSCAKRCDDGEPCNGSTNCLSNLCYAGVCQTPTCTDATQNGDETGKDCGGACAPCVQP